MPPPIAPAFARSVPVSEPVGWTISRSRVKVARVESSSPAACQPLASCHPPRLSAFGRSLGMWAVSMWGPSLCDVSVGWRMGGWGGVLQPVCSVRGPSFATQLGSSMI